MAMSRTAGRDTIPKGAQRCTKDERSGFTSCQPGDSFLIHWSSNSPPTFPLKKAQIGAAKVKMCTSAPHTVKGYADDLFVFSSSAQDHAIALSEIDEKSRDLDLTLRTNKCTTIIFDGNQMDHRSTIPLLNGHTRNISERPFLILGHLISSTTSKSQAASAKN